jgi:glycine cleavage system H lipoate-binding protein
MTGSVGQSGDYGLATSCPAECVWMQANVVGYKLCDRRYDCEHCPFDLALRAGSQPLTSISPTSSLLTSSEAAQSYTRQAHKPKQIDDYELAEAFFYHTAHTWAQVVGGGRVRVGLDDFGQRLLGRIYSVELPLPGASVACGRACWRVTHKAGETEFVSPVTGTVREVNARLAQQPSLLNREPYKEGWAFVVEPLSLGKCLKRLRFGQKAEEWCAIEIEKLYQRANEILNHELLKTPLEGLGQTLPDGGTRRKDLIGELEAAQARTLINSFFPAR